MLKTRLMSSIIGLAFLFVVMCSSEEVLGVSIMIIALIGVYEFFNSVSKKGYNPISFIGYLSCIPIVMIVLNEKVGVLSAISVQDIGLYSILSIFLLILTMFFLVIFKSEVYCIKDISITVFGIVYVPFLFSFIVLTRILENGLNYVWLIFVVAWITDTSAYFGGIKFGKHKLLEKISPKKTIEGSASGIVGCVCICLLFGYVLNNYFNINKIPLFHFALIGFIGSIISQIGDLSASVIKRYVNIKDFGKIMPGHGGVLDRFDSVLFVAPVVYFYFTLIVS